MGYTCKFNDKHNLTNGDLAKVGKSTVSADFKARFFGWFESYVANLEQGRCMGGHSRVQWTVLPIPGRYRNTNRSLAWVGNLWSLHHDWAELGAYQKAKFGIEWRELPSRPARARTDSAKDLLDISSLPA